MSPVKSTYKKLDWVLIGCYVALAVFGWLNIYASTYSDEAAGIFSLASRSGNQLLWIGVSATAGIILLLLFNSRFLHSMAWPLYVLSAMLLVAVLLFGHEVNGSKSWLSLPGGFAVQPSEFSKIATALCLSRVMGSFGFKLSRTVDFLKAAAIIIVPVGLIALEPDIGTILVYCSLAFMLYREGLPGQILAFAGFAILLFLLTLKFSPSVSILAAVGVTGTIMALHSRTPVRTFLIFAGFITASAFIPRLLAIESIDRINPLEPEYWLLVICLLCTAGYVIHCVRSRIRWRAYVIPLIVSFVLIFSVDFIFHNVLQPHHRDRIENLLGISQDLMGAGYNVNQSKIAIGSGGLTGKGFLEGTQTKFNFVPEQSTDFIFCTIGEEWGFMGCIAVLGLYLTIILRIIFSAERQRERGFRVYSYCVASIVFMHVFVNVGMTIGIMPVVGIPLPLISYGGSSFLTFTLLLFIHLRFDLERWK